jgi:predicted transcriptional regulator
MSIIFIIAVKYQFVRDISPNIRYTIRIFATLREHSEIGISDLAFQTGINHQRCNKILQQLGEQGYLILKSSKNGRKSIAVTPKGQDYITRLFSLLLVD